MQGVVIDSQEGEEGIGVNLKLEGELTLANAYDIKQSFIHTLNKYHELTITIRNVESIDVSFIQLVLSLKRAAKDLNKKVTLKLVLSQELSLLMEHSGFSDLLSLK